MSTTQEKRQSVIQAEEQNLKLTNDDYINPTTKGNVENIKELLYKLERTPLFVNRLDFFGNAIPIGAFSCAITFIILGFYQVKVYNNESQKFLSGIILIFGGLGQITSGLLEYLKARSFSALLYLTLGFFCFSDWFIEGSFYLYSDDIRIGGHEEKAFYYGAWFFIMLPLVLASLKINIFFLAQTGSTCIFFCCDG